jgi:hypothetical protein
MGVDKIEKQYGILILIYHMNEQWLSVKLETLLLG